MARTKRHSKIEWLNFNNRHSSEFPLLVNTAGYCDLLSPFETYNPVGRDDFYLMYIIEGELLLDMPDFKRTICRGDAFIIPPKHMYRYSGSERIYYLYVHFTGSYASRLLKECGFDSLPCVIENDFSTKLQKSFNSMIDIFLQDEHLSIQRCACLLQEILLSICMTMLDSKNNSPIKTSLKFIHSAFTERIDVPYLAGLEKLSISHYTTIFKKQTGKSPNEYIIDLRLQLAQNFLCSTNMSVKQISHRVGYADQYFFSRLFKKRLGVSPQVYRKQCVTLC
ncbi:MAG: helix-turn-helix domain-containing protein [Clostridia bacterium]|nr:helix-turn-helix domain-containing protein [Clostridia bacterium]